MVLNLWSPSRSGSCSESDWFTQRRATPFSAKNQFFMRLSDAEEVDGVAWLQFKMKGAETS